MRDDRARWASAWLALVIAVLTASTASTATGPSIPGSPHAPPTARVGGSLLLSDSRQSPAPASAHPASLIDPIQYRSTEPAPMGVADFGVTGLGAGASAYEYATPSLEGLASVDSMAVSIYASSSKVVAFELNAVVQFQRNGTNYTYWIQNGLHLDGSTHQFTIGGAYVWNFSTPGARLATGELDGNSSSLLASDTYYFIPSCATAFPGQCSIVQLPAQLTGRILSGTTAGTPFVEYQYDLGAGWVTYDTVSFPHLGGATDRGFVIDGFAPTPYGLNAYYDAEWVWVGAGGGARLVDQSSQVNLTLEFWNGHNYQAVPSAWDAGADTGETSSNVTARPALGSTPAADLTSGPGTLGVLYNGSQVGVLRVQVPFVGPETLLADGGAIPFEGGAANLTLSAGTHAVSLEGYANASAEVSVSAGGSTEINLSGAGRLVFREHGLPSGQAWAVTVNGTTAASSTSTVEFRLPNGSYPVTYPEVPGFHLGSAGPASVSLPGGAEVDLGFVEFTYNVPVTETGLPAGTPWWVDVAGLETRGTNSTLFIAAPNGTTPYTVGSSYAYLPDAANGTIVVAFGIPLEVSVSFTFRPAYIDGTVSPTTAAVSIGGLPLIVSEGAYQATLPPGTYTVTVTAPGYGPETQNVSATPGNVTWVNVTLLELPVTPPTSTPAASGPVALVLVVAVAAGAVVAAALAIGWVLHRRRE